MHRLEHVRGELAEWIVDLIDAFAFCPENRISVLTDGQIHFCSRVKEGRFFTPANLSASITLMIVPQDAFLSACKARDDFRVAGKLRTALPSSSTENRFPCSVTSSLSSTLTTACSISAGALVAVFESGRLI